VDPDVFAAEFDALWHREWIFVGHECELSGPGRFLTTTVGLFPLIVVRGLDGEIRALHNVCRHRGFVVCDQTSGSAGRRFVCPYHQWSYDLDGSFARAREMPDADLAELGLASAHCVSIGGLIYACVADVAPDLHEFRSMVEPYLGPFDLAGAVVAHRSTIVERGNWKLVWENNRECYHCRSHHPELCLSFSTEPLHSGGGSSSGLARLQSFVDRCEAIDVPATFRASVDWQYRVMRMGFDGDAESMTMSGRAAVGRRFPGLPADNVGDVLLYHYPSTWNHFVADHAVTFRVQPVSPLETLVTTTWLVPEGSVEGRDYELSALTEVWVATNAQDAALVERTQAGVTSPAYRPGPYAAAEEEGVMQFIDWYRARMSCQLTAS
jgi:phenylpropionate dioxygenase-like ring-hydroxylating dioxygenase large terminal subunit